MTDTTATKAGARHRASDAAVMKAMFADTKAYMKAMSDYYKALGFEDMDGDGDVTPAEVAEQGDAIKTLDLVTLSDMVCTAVREALDDLDMLEDDEDDPEMAQLAAMSGEVVGDYRKGSGYSDDADYPKIYVYADTAVACLGDGVDWRIPYAMEAGEVALGTPDTWERVGMEWEPIPGAAGVGEVKLLEDGSIVAQAVRFGSADEPDLSDHADYFTKSTDFWIGEWERRPMLYHHAMDEGTRDAPVIGAWVKAWVDDAGVWLQGQLDKAHKYHAAIKELARRGLLRVSTDSAPHLVQRERQANGTNEVKRWPIMAASLTPTAAEPRLLPAELKTLLAEAGIIDSSPEATDDDDRERRASAEAAEAKARRLALELHILELESQL